jgi:glucose-1-phosphate cytidylyltransferase
VKAVILAGGLGTRISEESQTRPKPMVEIGDRPILWHIMKIYSAAGITDFIVLLGYKGYMIKEYFTNYYLHSSDITVDLANNMIKTHESNTEPWSITLLDTGLETMTGGRLLRAKEYIGNETFCFTYGDGVTDMDMNNVIAYHRQNRTTITVTAVQPPSRYGKLAIDGTLAQFREKPEDDGG